MPIIHQLIQVKTEPGIEIYNITPQLVEMLDAAAIKQGQVLVFSRHTTTALAINENEERLLWTQPKALSLQSRDEGEVALLSAL